MQITKMQRGPFYFLQGGSSWGNWKNLLRKQKYDFTPLTSCTSWMTLVCSRSFIMALSFSSDPKNASILYLGSNILAMRRISLTALRVYLSDRSSVTDRFMDFTVKSSVSNGAIDCSNLAMHGRTQIKYKYKHIFSVTCH